MTAPGDAEPSPRPLPRRPERAIASEARSRAAVVFDLDGVLIDSEGLHYRAYAEVLRPFGARVSREVYAREWIATGRGPEWAVATFDLPISADALRARKEPVYRRLLERGATLMPGAADAVARLTERFRTAVATNAGRDETAYALERFGLLERFDAVVTRERYADAKPAPDAFLTAARLCGVPPARCLVVEDSERGLRAAAAAGMRAVAIPNEWTRAHDLSSAARRLASLDALTAERVEDVLAPDSR